MSTTHAVLTLAFSATCAYSLYSIWSSTFGTPPASAAPGTCPPPMDHDELLALLQDVRGRVEGECRGVAAALSLAAAEAPDTVVVLREHARARVQAALSAAGAAALAARGVGEARAERALAYWEGPGRSSEAAAVARDIRTAAGEWVLSQRRAVRLFEGFFEARTEALLEAAQRHAEARAGAGGSGAHRLRGFDLKAADAAAVEAGKAFVAAQGGLTLEKLQAAVQGPAFAKVGGPLHTQAHAVPGALTPPPPSPPLPLPSSLSQSCRTPNSWRPP